MKRVNILNQPRKDWLLERAKSIGASDSSAVLGINPWKSNVELWLEKTNPESLLAQPDNLNMRLGRDMEPILRQLFTEETGLQVRQDNHIRYDDEYPFLSTNLDGRIVGDKVPIELKTTGMVWDGMIPDNYFCQLQHQMMVTKSPYIYFAVLVLSNFGKQFIVEKYERNERFIADMRAKMVDFWMNYVVTGIAPDPVSVKDARLLYKDTIQESVIEGSFDMITICEKIKDYNKDIKKIKSKADELRVDIMDTMKEDEIMTYKGSILSTWKKSKGKVKFDLNKFKKDHPELYEEYATPKDGNRMLIIK
jgi:putative phage-type endonuclease